MTIKGVLRLLTVGLLALVPVSRAKGQAVSATILGLVSDPSGAVIPGANVTVLELKTGVSSSRQTNASGNYEFPNLAPGTYTVSAEEKGFKTTKSDAVVLVVNSTVRVNLAMTVGSESQQVEVQAVGSMMQTDRADVTTNLDAKQVEDLPNLSESQNFQALTSLAPGVSEYFHDQGPAFDAQESAGFEVNGQSQFANNTQFEGIDDNERTGLLQIYLPAAQAIQAVNISTSNYAPEFGRAGGAVTNVLLKSGTNEFHGSVFEYNETAAVQALNYFHSVGPKPGLTNNYYGFTIGGPIVHDKTFFFGDLLRYDNHNQNYNLITLPTAAFRAGDFTASKSKIIDPTTGKQFAYQGVKNTIDPTRFSPVALKLLALLPVPNVPGAGLTQNFTNTTGFAKDSTQFDVKIDQNLRAADRLTGRYSFQRVTTFLGPTFGLAGGSNGKGIEGTGSQNAYNTALEYVRVISPKLLTELRGGVSHYRNLNRPADYGTQASAALGIPGVNVDAFTSGIVGITLGKSFSDPFIGYAASTPWDRGESNIDGVNNWTATLGNHSIMFGVEARRIRDDLTQGQTFSPRGLFTYSDGPTSSASSGKTTSANNFASFLLDLPSQVGRDVNVTDASWRQTLYFGFAQDTWQASRNLTVMYGGRWELYPPPVPRKAGGFSNYDPANNTLEVAGIGSVPMNLGVQTNYGDFAPRLGFSYRAHDTTVVRGGFGISYESFPDNQYAFNAPVRQNNAYNPVGSFGSAGVALLPDGTPASLSKGFPAPAVITVPSSGIIPNAAASSVYTVANTKYRDPYVMSYNLTVAQEFGHNFLFDIAYVGNQGREIPAGYNLNAGLIPGAGAKGQPEYASFGRTAETDLLGIGTNSNYNSLQVRLNRRTSKGLTTTTSYTFGKAMGYISSQQGLDYYSYYVEPRRNYSRLAWDQTHMFHQSILYALPFGRDQSFLQHGVASWVLGGWEVGSILALDSGFPLTFTASTSSYNAPGNEVTANQTKPFVKLKGIGVGNPWFDTSAFSSPVGTSNGNTGRNIYSGPVQLHLDASITRDFALTERVHFGLRVLANQVTNTPIFNTPTTSITSPDFGDITHAGGNRQLQFAGTLKF